MPLHLMEGAGEAPAVPLTQAVVMIHAAADSYNQQRCQGTVRPVESRLYLCRAKAERARRARGWTRRAADALLNQKRATDGTRACDDGAVHRCEREMIHAAVCVPLGDAADVWLEVARALGAERQHAERRQAARQKEIEAPCSSSGRSCAGVCANSPVWSWGEPAEVLCVRPLWLTRLATWTCLFLFHVRGRFVVKFFSTKSDEFLFGPGHPHYLG